MPHDAFVSYSSHDKTVADAACAALEAAGVRCWIAPRDITPGAEWGEAIIEAINHCRAMILIFSANANDSPQIRREVERAVSKGVPVLPLRIQDIEPAHSLEYFIGTVHWLDALTPPLEGHLLRLADSVKALLQIDPIPPRIVAPPLVDTGATKAPTSRNPLLLAALGGLAVLVVGGAGFGVRWVLAPGDKVATQASSAARAAPIAPAPAATRVDVDPALVGTYEHSTVIDDYDWRFVDTITADGNYDLSMTESETGTFQSGNGHFKTVGDKTGRVRTGTYRALGPAAIEVTGAAGSVIFQPAQPGTTVDPVNPAMLGVWRATVVKDGLTWTLTIKNNPDHTYRFEAHAEDKGACSFADRQWRTISAVTGQSIAGVYRVIDPHTIELTSATGAIVWQRI